MARKVFHLPVLVFIVGLLFAGCATTQQPKNTAEQSPKPDTMSIADVKGQVWVHEFNDRPDPYKVYLDITRSSLVAYRIEENGECSAGYPRSITWFGNKITLPRSKDMDSWVIHPNVKTIDIDFPNRSDLVRYKQARIEPKHRCLDVGTKTV